MPIGTLKLRLRPLKFAFLVPPGESKALTQAVETSSFLWGGAYNPIVPFYRKLPKIWGKEGLHAPNADKVVEGYLDAFDPDVVVKTGTLENQEMTFSHREVIKCSEILRGLDEYGAPNYGIGMIEVLRNFVRDEFTFVRHQPIQIALPEIGAEHRLFLSSVFGVFSSDVEKLTKSWWKGLPGVESKACSLNNYSEFLNPKNLFLRRLGCIDIEVTPRSFRRADCLFLMDANNNLDIIDYWNLRALGWSVVPVCKQVSSQDDVIAMASEFVERNSYPLRGNPNIFNNTTLLRGRSLHPLEVENFGKSLKLSAPKHVHDTKLVYNFSYPRIWDEWAREKDGAEPCELQAGEQEYEINQRDDTVNFHSLVPDFAVRYKGGNGPLCANETELRVYGSDTLPAEIIPEGNWTVARAAGAFDFDEWRCGKLGLVHLPKHKNWRERLSLTSASSVFSAWLKEKGWDAQLSNNGHIATQMVKHLGGLLGVDLLAKKTAIDLFEKLASGAGQVTGAEEESDENQNDLAQKDFGRAMHADAFKAALKKIAEEDTWKIATADDLAARYIKRNMVQLGLKIQCPECRQRSWYSIKEADYDLRCPQCLSEFRLPEHNPADLNWAYRAIGPFSLPRRAYGVYSVLLTLRFFTRLLDGATTPMLSFTAKKGPLSMEADLGLFFQKSKYTYSQTYLIFAECKTFGHFKPKDVSRMIALAKEFPGTLLVFATLRKTLTAQEKKLLRPIVNRGRKYWKAERPNNPVLILTGTELFADDDPRDVWKKMEPLYSAHSQSWGDSRNLIGLADATQQIYLGMPSRFQTIAQRRAAKHSKSNVKTIPTTGQSPVDQKAEKGLPVSFPVAMRQVPSDWEF